MLKNGPMRCNTLSWLAKLKYDPNLCESSKVAVEGFRASEKLKNMSGESLDLQKTIDLGNEEEQGICKSNDYLLNTCNPDFRSSRPEVFSKKGLQLY